MAKPSNDFHNNTSYKEVHGLNSKDFIIDRNKKRSVKYKFLTHYHPYSGNLIYKLNMEGIQSILDARYQESLKRNLSVWLTKGPALDGDFPYEEIDVSDDGPYSIYNWELLMFAPLTIATHLSKNLRFAEADKWFKYIFDPTNNDTSVPVPQRFWKFLRFRQETTPKFIDEMLTKLSKGEDAELKEKMEKSILAWRNKPFQPHVIARTRYLAYQINVVMKYLDNLIAWGDYLFRQDTMESLNEATQVYVLATNLLGPKPMNVRERGKKKPKTYKQLKEVGIDAFGNAMIEIENEFPFNTNSSTSGPVTDKASSTAFGIVRSLYFCIPQNEKLLQYWDTVNDRLFKIRHCMNLEGVVRQLPLFDPPLDPGMLVKAVAAGMNIGSIINNINQPVSTIRGPLLLQKSLEICNEVRALGSSMLSALEKKDAAQLGSLRQQHETGILKLVQDVKFLRWKDSESATEALLQGRAIAFEKYRHFKRILGENESDLDELKVIDLVRNDLNETSFDEAYNGLVSQYAKELSNEDYRKETSVGGAMEFAGSLVTDIFGGELGKTLPLNKNENAELNIFLPTHDTFSTLSTVLKLVSPIVALIPQMNIHATPLGVGGAAEFGGEQLKDAADAGSELAQKAANAFAKSADRAARMASYYRRAEDFVFNANLATQELMQYGRQIISSLIREQVAKREYENHLKQIEYSEEIQAFLQDKFTNEELYNWMQGEISKIHYSSYQFAFDLARKSEQTMKYELMRQEFDDLNIIKFGYWDSTKKGLLAGKSLLLDLKRLEMAYYENIKREYEMTKHISLHRLDPLALLKLKATGSCEFEIPEWLYDIDSPGQYMRRIKSVSVSIPCTVGPYTSIHARLSLLKSSIRIKALTGDYKRTGPEDDRFRDFFGSIQSIVTSSGQNDSGMFEPAQNDVHRLPFEGAGAISKWKVELPNDIPQFNFETISDVILHVRYTGREARHLKSSATQYVKEEILQGGNGESMVQLFNLNHNFPDEWNTFRNAENDSERILSVHLSKEDFPYWTRVLGMEDSLVVTFCTLDFSKNKVVVASENIALTGDESSGWNLEIDNSSSVPFNFLKKIYERDQEGFMVVSYQAKS